MDAANIEVALKNDQKYQERSESKEVYAKEAAAGEPGQSREELGSRGAPTEFAERCSEQKVFVPVPNHDQDEEQEILITHADEEQPGQDEATVLVQRLQDFESVVVGDGSRIRVLDETTAESLQQLQQHLKHEQVIPEQQQQSQPTTYPLPQSFQPVYFPGEVLQVLNPVQQNSLENASLGIRSTPFIQSADLYRLIRMFPDFHSKTLHRILAYCHGDFKRAIDQTLFARQLRVIDLGPPQIPTHIHPHHTAPYRIPRGSFPARTHSPFFLYPESSMDGFGSPIAPQRRSTVVQPTLQTGVAPPSGATPLGSVHSLPSFQSVFVPVFQANKTQQSVQDISRIVVPDVLMPDGMSAVHVVKLDQLNSTEIPERQERVRLSTELESTMPVTSQHELVQPTQTTVRRILEDGVIETIPVKAGSLTPKTQVMVNAEKVMDVGAAGDTENTGSTLLVNLTEEISEKQRSIISH